MGLRRGQRKHSRRFANQRRDAKSSRAFRSQWICVHGRSRDGTGNSRRAVRAAELVDRYRFADGATKDGSGKNDVAGEEDCRYLSESRGREESATRGVLAADRIV